MPPTGKTCGRTECVHFFFFFFRFFIDRDDTRDAEPTGFQVCGKYAWHLTCPLVRALATSGNTPLSSAGWRSRCWLGRSKRIKRVARVVEKQRHVQRMRERTRIVWRQQVRLNIAYATVSSLRFCSRDSLRPCVCVCVCVCVRARARDLYGFTYARACMRGMLSPSLSFFPRERPFVNIS